MRARPGAGPFDISVIDRQRAAHLSPVRVACFAEFALELLKCPGAQVTILLVSDRGIRSLNRRWRGKDCATDVLSFPQRVPGQEGPHPEVLGDIVVSVETALRHTQDVRCCIAAEIDRLVLHGLLHLLGYEHEGDRAAAWAMRRREQSIIKRWLA